jgi:hypothetical protein
VIIHNQNQHNYSRFVGLAVWYPIQQKAPKRQYFCCRFGAYAEKGKHLEPNITKAFNTLSGMRTSRYPASTSTTKGEYFPEFLKGRRHLELLRY